MKPGPKPKPQLRLVGGRTPGRRPSRRASKAKPRAPAAPSWLSKEARAEWRRVVPELDRLGLLCAIDRGALAVYCATWATFVEAQRDVARRGSIVAGHRKKAVKNPALQVARDAAQLLRALAAEFGLTPSARLRFSEPGPPDDDEDEDLYDA